jgi:Ankyrin repeats (3 copies)/Domain of unknown function (DUF4375)
MQTPIQRIMASIREGTIDQFQQLLSENPELLAESGPHMLEHAATNDRFDVMELLVEAGVGINAATGGDTPLSSASRDGSVEAVQWLLDHGAEVNGRNSASTPLEEAIMEGRLEIVELLLASGADPDILHGNPQRNALSSARFWGQDEIAGLLESKGVTEIVVEPELVNVETPEFLDRSVLVNSEAWFDRKWGPVFAYGTKRGLEALSQRNRVLFLVGYLVDQLANGGAEMLYFNPSAEYVTQMPSALELIGASEAARVIRELNSLFPDGAPAKDMETRAEQLRAITEEATRLGEELEATFDEWLPDGSARVLIDQLYRFWYA